MATMDLALSTRRGGARREGEAPEALRPLRHVLLPRLHAGRAGHDRHGGEQRRAGLHVADLPRPGVLHPVRAAHLRARVDLHRGGRPVHLDEARARPVRQRGERAHLLGREPDLARRHALHHRRRDLRGVLHRPRQLEVHLRPRCSSGSPSGRRSSRSASASGCRRSAPGAGWSCSRFFTRHRRHLRDQARRARRRAAATSSPRTPYSSRSCRCSSSTTSASSCRTPRATR